MKFIFPKNYRYKNRLFGIIDYSTAIINLVFYVIVYFITNLIFKQISVKIFVFVLVCFPCFLLSIVGSERENIFFVMKYVIKYIKSPKLYLYK